MKKRVFFVLFISSMLNGYSASSHFILNGKLKGITSGNAELSYCTLENNKNVKMIVPVRAGNFLFKGCLTEPAEAEIKINGVEATLYIEPTSMKLYMSKDQPGKFKLTGSKTQNECDQLNIKREKDDKLLELTVKQWRLKQKQLDSIYEDNPNYKRISIERNILWQKRDSIFKSLVRITTDFMKSNPDSYYPILSNYLGVYLSQGFISLDSSRAIFNNLTEKVRNYQMSIVFDNYLKIRENVAIGKIAPDFTVKDMNGKEIRLSDYQGTNYVLLEFWASYCGPCISGIPHLKKLYAKYHDKGFEIIGISSDQSIDNWKSSIDKHQIFIWPQVCAVKDIEKSLQGFSNKEDIKEKYPLDGIPRQVLIDKTGRICAKWDWNSTENEIDNFFKNVFGE